MHITSISMDAGGQGSIPDIIRKQVECFAALQQRVTAVSDYFGQSYPCESKITIKPEIPRACQFGDRIAMAGWNRLPRSNLKSLLRPKNFFREIYFPRTANKWLTSNGRSGKFDCLLTNQCAIPPWLSGSSQALAVPSVFVEHGDVFTYGWSYFGLLTTAYYRWCMKKIFRSVDHLIVVNQRAAEAAKARGVPGDRISIIPNGIDLEEVGSTIPKPVGQSGPFLNLLFVGELVARKGVPELLHALALLKGKPIFCRLAGVGRDEKKYHELAHALEIDSMVEFLGYVQRKNLGQYYAAADAFVLPSFAEGRPAAMLEAMACGLPVIASDIPGISDTIRHGCEGLLVPPGNPNRLAEALNSVASNPEMIESMGKFALRKAEDFSWKKVGGGSK
ncbi:MAG: glycosyltransferase family 4 protein [Verrucomicrobiota bacterium]